MIKGYICRSTYRIVVQLLMAENKFFLKFFTKTFGIYIIRNIYIILIVYLNKINIEVEFTVLQYTIYLQYYVYL